MAAEAAAGQGRWRAVTSRTVRVAALQLESRPGEAHTNLRHATPFVEQAARAGAELIVLPALYAPGYLVTRRAWEVAEAAGGPTYRWLARTARRLGIYLGCGLAEADGEECFNSYVLAGPDGRIIGTARKTDAESYAFRRGAGIHVIDSPLGRLGVGICGDNELAFLPKLMARASVDLLLMPHARPTPERATWLASEADVAMGEARTKGVAPGYAKLLGVPVVFVNQVGELTRVPGLLGGLMALAGFRLPGFSRIVNADGAVVAQLADEEGVACAHVVLDQARKHFAEPPSYRGRLLPGTFVLGRIVVPLDIAAGRLCYRLSTRARRKALSG